MCEAGRFYSSDPLLTIEDSFNISFAVQNPNDVDDVFVQQVINPDGFKSSNRPLAEILKLRIARKIARTHKGMFASGLNGVPDSLPETNGNFRKIPGKEIMAKLPNEVVAGSLPIRNLHEWGAVLCSANMASVCLLTEPQNSSSVSIFDASPSASKMSSSSCVPAKPGTVRCSTALKAASTTSSTDWYPPRLMTG